MRGQIQESVNDKRSCSKSYNKHLGMRKIKSHLPQKGRQSVTRTIIPKKQKKRKELTQRSIARIPRNGPSPSHRSPPPTPRFITSATLLISHCTPAPPPHKFALPIPRSQTLRNINNLILVFLRFVAEFFVVLFPFSLSLLLSLSLPLNINPLSSPTRSNLFRFLYPSPPSRCNINVLLRYLPPLFPYPSSIRRSPSGPPPPPSSHAVALPQSHRARK